MFRALAALVPDLLADPTIADVDLAQQLTSDSVREVLIAGLKLGEAKALLKCVYYGTKPDNEKRMFSYLRDIPCPLKSEECHGLKDETANALIDAWQRHRAIRLSSRIGNENNHSTAIMRSSY